MRIPEKALVLPTLYLMEANGGSITTAELQPKLLDIMKPQGEDLVILANRGDSKFSQKVRNLISHETLTNLGYANYDAGILRITEDGKTYLTSNSDFLRYLLSNDFSYDDIGRGLQILTAKSKPGRIEAYDENVVIGEGLKTVIDRPIYVRSKLLRDFAIRFYTKNGRIDCSCCSFNFSDFYGIDLGKNFIEIHHVKPVFTYQGVARSASLAKAVQNLSPVCSNCHRMIHCDWKKPLEMKNVIDHITANGRFSRFKNSP